MRSIITLLMISMLFVFNDGRCIASDKGNYRGKVDSKLFFMEEKIDNKIEDLKKTYTEIEKKYDKQINQIKLDLKETSTLTKANDKNVSVYLSIVAIYTGILFALVSIILGIGLFKVYIDNKRINEKIESELKNKVANMTAKIEQEIHDYSYYRELKMLLEQDSPDPNDVYFLVTPLCQNFREIYRPVFEKIKKRKIDEEIITKVDLCLKNMSE